LSGQITVEEHNFLLEKDAARLTASIVCRPSRWWAPGLRDPVPRIPSGYEFMSLIEAIRLVSAGDSGLTEASRALIGQIQIAARAPGVRHPH